MAITRLTKLTRKNSLPTKIDERAPVYAKSFNKALDAIEELSDIVDDLNDGTINTESIELTGALTTSLTTDATTKDTGSIITEGGIGVEKAIVTGTSITAGTNIIVNGATDSTSSTTGSLKTAGGLGVAKAAFIGTSLTANTSIITDVISEKTAATGVTIDSVLLKDNTVLVGSGAVGTPSVQVGASDTGLYALSATQTGIAQDGVLVATVDGSGLTADSLRNRVQLGTTPVGTVSVVEYGDSRDITTVLTLTNFIVGALDGAAADKGIGNIIYSFPAGQHFELVSSLSSIVLTAAGTAVATDTGLGSVIASGVVSVLSGTATFEDRLTGQTINTAAGGGAAVSALTAATAGIGTGISLNVAASVKDVFLNSAGTWNVDNTGNLTASGTIVLKWTRM